MKRRTKIVAAVIVLVVIAAIVATVALGAGTTRVSVDVAEVQSEDLAITVTASGRVESGIRADVLPPVAGTIEDVFVEDGDEVQAGTVLARLDKAPLEATVAQARAAVAQSEAQRDAVDEQQPTQSDLAAARAGSDAAWSQYQAALAGISAVDDQAPSETDIEAAAAATNAAIMAYDLANDAYEALRTAYELAPGPALETSLTAAYGARDQARAAYLQALSAEQKLRSFDLEAQRLQARATADQAHAAYLSARAQQSKLEDTGGGAQREAAQASVDQARKALVIAEENLERATLVAPVDGVVLFNALGTPSADGITPKVAPGAAVGPQAALFTVVQLEGVRFTADIDEVDIDQIDVGMRAEVSLDAFPDTVFEATVARVMPAASLTLAGGTVFNVHLALEGAERDLLIGMKGDATVEVDSVPGAITVPVEALFDEGGTRYVYVLEGDRLSRTRVEAGTLTETRAQITAGIEPGMKVALSGPVELVDGMRVSVAD